MVLESAQMIATCVLQRHGRITPYRPTHDKHPCNVWLRQRPEHLGWLVEHFVELATLFSQRSGRHHQTYLRYAPLLPEIRELCTYTEPEYFANCAANSELGISFKDLPVVKAYQEYLKYRWNYTDVYKPTWTNRSQPPWL